MSIHHVKIAIRNLKRSKVYGLVNILGLSVGIASVLIIALFIRNELSYDQFFDDSESIYRIALHRIYPDRTRDFASSVITLAPALKDNYPEVEAITRMHRLFFTNQVNVRIDDDTYTESHYLFADSSFFKVFSHHFIHGDPASALNAPDKVVITRSTAIKYFGHEDVLDQTLQVGTDTSHYLISGVIADLPQHTHFRFDLLGSIHSIGYLQNAIESNSWINPWVYTYVKLAAGTSPDIFAAKVGEAVKQFGAPSISRQLGADYVEAGHRFDYFLQPISDIHLHSKLTIEVEPNSDITYVYLLALIGLVILIISSINYINLSVARAPTRAREVGIRKVVGSSRRSLIVQFLMESMLICFIGSIIATGLAWICMPYFNSLVSTQLSISPLLQPRLLFSFVLFILLLSLLSGLYPALVIAAFKPARILKGAFKRTRQGVQLRNGLMTLQFIISMVMISGSVLIHQQMNYLRQKDLGFDKEEVVVIRQANRLGNQYESFKNEISRIPGVIASGGANGLPGDFHGSGVFKTANPQASDLRANIVNFDDDFFEAMNFELVAGRSFQEAFNDSLSILINEAVVSTLDLREPIGEQFWNAGNVTGEDRTVFTVVGVIKDYHFYSLHNEIGPLVVFNISPLSTPPNLVVKINASKLDQTLVDIQDTWAGLSQDDMNFSFLDQDLQAQYESDAATSFLFDIFTYLAIFMCCIGLFALATFVAQQRRKEMSIRKVLGASVGSIVLSFSKEFLTILIVAFVVGIPIAYFSMERWLENFPYHVSISGNTFILAGALLVLFVILTISYQAIRLATVSPANSLRTE